MAGHHPSLATIKRVEIAGGIASGKTTLARLMATVGLGPVHEQFRKNPFFEAFYKDPVGTAFETEITFLLQHYHLQRAAKIGGHSYCADFSLVLDHAYAFVTLQKRDRKLFEAVYRRAEEQLVRRSLLIVLKCSPEIELHRIRRRQRAAEATISLSYLKHLDRALVQRVDTIRRHAKVLVIDSGIIDFARNEYWKTHVKKLVKNALNDRQHR